MNKLLIITIRTRKKREKKIEKPACPSFQFGPCLLFPSLPASAASFFHFQSTTAARLNPPSAAATQRLPRLPQAKGRENSSTPPTPLALPSRLIPHMAALRLCEQLKKNDPCSSFSDPCADPRSCPDLAASYASLRVHRTCS